MLLTVGTVALGWRLVFVLAVGVLTVGATAMLALPANADPNDDFRYCTALNRQGFRITDCSLFALIGKGQCGHFARGRTATDAMHTTEEMWDIDPQNAEIILRTAVAVYCPVYEPLLSAPNV